MLGAQMLAGPLDFVPEQYRAWVVFGGIGLIGLLVLRVILGSIFGLIRKRRAPTIHPKLQKYNQDPDLLDQQRREAAQQIVATSTGNRLAGYRIVRQVDAVFVEGLRTPEDAVLALKAAAAERGANAILNVNTERTAAGKCTASGDAIVVAPPLNRPSRSP